MNWGRTGLLVFWGNLILGSGGLCGQSMQEIELDENLKESSETFSGSEGVKVKDVPPAVNDFFKTMAKATRNEAAIQGADFFSGEELFEEAKRSGGVEDLEKAQLEGLKLATPLLVQQLAQSMKMMAYDEFRVVRLEKLEGKKMLVYVRHYDNVYNISSAIRWWLVEDEEGQWRCYDFEDLDSGMRTTTMMVVGMRAGLKQGPEAKAWVNKLLLVVRVMQTKGLEDLDAWAEIEKPILDLYADKNVPKKMKGFIGLMKVSLHLVEEEVDEGLATLAEMREEEISIPVWHYLRANLLMMDENYDEAIEELKSHAKFMGWDSDSLELVADCHYFLGDSKKAREVALRGLADNPRASTCAATWAACSSVAELEEEAPALFAKGKKWEEQFYEDSLDYLLDLEELEKAEVLYEIFQKQVKKSELFDYYDEVFEEIAEEE